MDSGGILGNIALLLVGFLLSIIGALIGAWVQRALDCRAERRPLNQLLNFGSDELLFVFPHREEIREAVLPRTSTEDFMAMNNFISALINVGWTRGFGVRDTRHIRAEDKKRNLVIICSPKSNTFADEFQKKLRERGIRAFYFEETDRTRWHITDGDGVFLSGTWEQEENYHRRRIGRHKFPEMCFDDFGVVTKITNPWNPKNKVVWIAGIRGIGTWGAAECVKKRWKQIYDQLPMDAKETDFSALVRIRYDNCDISAVDVRRVVTLPEAAERDGRSSEWSAA